MKNLDHNTDYLTNIHDSMADINIDDFKHANYGSKILRFKQGNANNPVHILLDCDDRPSVNFDIINMHGRRSLDIRLNGMSIFSMLLDVDALGYAGDSNPRRFCPICGEKINLLSSRGHSCKLDPEEAVNIYE